MGEECCAGFGERWGGKRIELGEVIFGRVGSGRTLGHSLSSSRGETAIEGIEHPAEPDVHATLTQLNFHI